METHAILIQKKTSFHLVVSTQPHKLPYDSQQKDKPSTQPVQQDNSQLESDSELKSDSKSGHHQKPPYKSQPVQLDNS